MKYLILILVLFTNTAHAGLFQGIADFYNSRDRCQLKNYPGGVQGADPSQLPRYCGKGRYARIDAIQRGKSVQWPSGFPLELQTNSVERVLPIRGGGWLITHRDGRYEYVSEREAQQP